MRRALIVLTLLLAAAAPARAQVTIASAVNGTPAGTTFPTSANGGYVINDATDTAYADQGAGTLTLVPVNMGVRKKAWSALTGHAPSFLSVMEWAPVGTRTAQSASNQFRTYVSGSGSFGASIRGVVNYVDVATTGSVGTVYAGMTELFARAAGTKTNFNAQYTAVYAQNAGHVTTAMAHQSIIEADGPGSVIDSGIVYYGYADAAGGTLSSGTVFYADDSSLAYADKASYYASASSGQAQFDDGAKAPIMSYGASSVLTVSSNVIAPTNGVHHLGAGLVKTITVPTRCTPTCTIAIVPDAAFTTDTTGNVGLASTAVVGRVLIFAWDGTKWWPSY